MRYLNLNPEFIPFEKGIEHESFMFSGGEPHIKLLEKTDGVDSITITTRLNSFNHVGLLCVAVDALKRSGVNHLHLFVPYFPGARQDRLMVAGEPLTVKVYADLVNQMKFETVTILDPHSDVTPALLNNVRVLSNHHFVHEVIKDLEEYVLISPDAGALKKVFSLAKFLGTKNVVECGKVRNVVTGQLSSFSVSKPDLKGQTCIIVDDICDGGGTFLGLAEKLKEHNAGDLILIVTHGIFSKGTEELKKHYVAIHTTDSIGKKLDGVTEFKIKNTERWKV